MTIESKPSSSYKPPIRYKGRDYFFYSYTRTSLLVYAANRKDGERSNPVIIVDGPMGIINEGELREFRRLIE